jgi:hypothetical protein
MEFFNQIITDYNSMELHIKCIFVFYCCCLVGFYGTLISIVYTMLKHYFTLMFKTKQYVQRN